MINNTPTLLPFGERVGVAFSPLFWHISGVSPHPYIKRHHHGKAQ